MTNIVVSSSPSPGRGGKIGLLNGKIGPYRTVTKWGWDRRKLLGPMLDTVLRVDGGALEAFDFYLDQDMVGPAGECGFIFEAHFNECFASDHSIDCVLKELDWVAPPKNTGKARETSVRMHRGTRAITVTELARMDDVVPLVKEVGMAGGNIEAAHCALVQGRTQGAIMFELRMKFEIDPSEWPGLGMRLKDLAENILDARFTDL
ncbi:MAG: hypothetical protein FLDDKLPJ_00226 [Phycisphaerae bacterium]|nr:hypothetical protein [Phycisphaerae bacterium]